MFKYIGKRLLYLILVLLGVSFIVFTLLYISPGDPARIMLGEAATEEACEALREQLGLNDPFLVRFFNYIKDIVVHQDLGTSYSTRGPVSDQVFAAFPVTVQLAASAIVVAVLVGVTLGVLAAVKQNSIIDNLVMVFALLGTSIPIFWFGSMMIVLFSVKLQWLPPSGYGTWQQMIMPAIALGLQSTAMIARMTRYVKTARAKGQREFVVIMRHVFRNALIPIITVVGLQFGQLLGGAILTEMVFSIPGLGRLIIDAITERDYPVVQGGVLVVAASFSLVNLVVDLLYAVADPKIARS